MSDGYSRWSSITSSRVIINPFVGFPIAYTHRDWDRKEREREKLKNRVRKKLIINRIQKVRRQHQREQVIKKRTQRNKWKRSRKHLTCFRINHHNNKRASILKHQQPAWLHKNQNKRVHIVNVSSTSDQPLIHKQVIFDASCFFMWSISNGTILTNHAHRVCQLFYFHRTNKDTAKK